MGSVVGSGVGFGAARAARVVPAREAAGRATAARHAPTLRVVLAVCRAADAKLADDCEAEELARVLGLGYADGRGETAFPRDAAAFHAMLAAAPELSARDVERALQPD